MTKDRAPEPSIRTAVSAATPISTIQRDTIPSFVKKSSSGAEIAKAFELGPFDITVEKLEEVGTAVGQYSPDAGEKLVVATLTIKNVGMRPQEVHYSILEPKLRSEDGDDLTWTYGLLRMTSAEQLNMSIDPGQHVRARMVFKAPVAAKASRLIIREQASGRSVAVAVDGA